MKRRLPFMFAVPIFALGLISCSSQENITSDSYVMPDESTYEADATAQPEPENDIILDFEKILIKQNLKG